MPQTQAPNSLDREDNKLYLEQQQENSIDRISELPKDVKQKILLSYWLETKDAAKMMFMSRSWKDTWLTLPSLDLGFVSSGSSIDHVLRAIDYILTSRSKCADKKLLKLTICIPQLLLDRSHDSTSRLLDKWVDFIVNDFRVEELDFWIESRSRVVLDDAQESNSSLYEFPTGILTSERQGISRLELARCALKSLLSTRWTTLRYLSLYRVRFDQKVLDSFTCNCPLIEHLQISNCIGKFDTIKASHLKRLVDFMISTKRPLKRIEINAPNLRYFSYKWEYYEEIGRYCVINNLSHSKDLKHLSIQNDKGLSPEWLDQNLGRFPKLEYLNLFLCDGVKHLKVTGNCARYIYLSTCYNLKDVTINDAPQLYDLKYTGEPIPCFKLSNTPSLKRVRLDLSHDDDNEDVGYEGLVRFLSAFGHLQEVELLDARIIATIPNDSKKNLDPPLVGVKTLIAKLDNCAYKKVKRLDYKSLLDTLLWVAPRLDSLTIKFLQDHKIIRFKYEEDEGMLGKCDNCSRLPVRCWRHSQVTFETEKYGPDFSPLAKQHDAVLRAFFDEQLLLTCT